MIATSGGLGALVPALAVQEMQRVRQVLQSSLMIPPYYRRHLHVTSSGDEVAIAVYREPDALPYDCKIDAVLMASKVVDADPAARRVVVAFYDVSDAEKYWRVAVHTADVINYAEGGIDKEQVLRAAQLEPRQTNELSKEYADLNYRQMIKDLGVLPGADRTERTVALLRIESMEQQGRYVGDLQKHFLHMEDLVRRGESLAARQELQVLEARLNEEYSAARTIN